MVALSGAAPNTNPPEQQAAADALLRKQQAEAVARTWGAEGIDAPTWGANNKNGFRPLHAALDEEKTAAAETLVRGGADVNVRDIHRQTPLHYAALRGLTTAVSLLIANGADVDPKNTWMYTPLHKAAINGSVTVAKLLLNHAADVNARSKDGKTALGLATRHRQHEVASFLLAAGGVY